MDPVVVYVLRCVQNGSESLGLKALEAADCASRACTRSLTIWVPLAVTVISLKILFMQFHVGKWSP
jgi:hypothetical protein